jgi:hypothetical protein
MAARKSIAWAPIILGYLIGSFFSVMKLWAWIMGLVGGKSRTAQA